MATQKNHRRAAPSTALARSESGSCSLHAAKLPLVAHSAPAFSGE